jgi:hypothetical protein
VDIIFQSHPDVIIAGNTFRRCPIILQYEQTPIIEVGTFAEAGYTTRFSVFHNDGTKIAVIKGAQMFRTDEGKKAKLEFRYPQDATVCELEGKPIFELRRTGPTALKGWAELYAPEGVLIKVSDAESFARLKNDERLVLQGTVLAGNVVADHKIGLHVTRNGFTLGA